MASANFLFGLACLLGVVVLWVASSELIQYIFSHNAWDKPFALTYFNCSACSIYLLVTVPLYLFPHLKYQFRSLRFWSPGLTDAAVPRSGAAAARAGVGAVSMAAGSSSSSSSSSAALLADDDVASTPAVAHDGTPLSADELINYTYYGIARSCLVLAPSWFCGNLFLNWSLELTSTTSAMIMSNTSSFFALVLGRISGAEVITPTKIAATVCMFAGIVTVALADSGGSSADAAAAEHVVRDVMANSTNGTDVDAAAAAAAVADAASAAATAAAGHEPMTMRAKLGDFLALMSAFFYALYAVLLKTKYRCEEKLELHAVFSCMGVYLMSTMWIVGLLLHISRFELFDLPPRGALPPLFLNALLSTIMPEYLWLTSILYTSPLIGTMGLSLTIPLAMIYDHFAKGDEFSIGYVLGCILVVVGFCLANASDLSPGDCWLWVMRQLEPKKDDPELGGTGAGAGSRDKDKPASFKSSMRANSSASASRIASGYSSGSENE